jgi:hypothetical protein
MKPLIGEALECALKRFGFFHHSIEHPDGILVGFIDIPPAGPFFTVAYCIDEASKVGVELYRDIKVSPDQLEQYRKKIARLKITRYVHIATGITKDPTQLFVWAEIDTFEPCSVKTQLLDPMRETVNLANEAWAILIA